MPQKLKRTKGKHPNYIAVTQDRETCEGAHKSSIFAPNRVEVGSALYESENARFLPFHRGAFQEAAVTVCPVAVQEIRPCEAARLVQPATILRYQFRYIV
jgi:hypothetical protein